MTDLLYEWGIQTEDSTHHLHIDVFSNMAFVFPTADGVDSLPDPISCVTDEDYTAGGYYVVYPKWANGYPTARGIRVPYTDINNCKAIKMPIKIKGIDDFDRLSTSAKGRLAEGIGQMLMERGDIPIQLNTIYVNAKDAQIFGTDITCNQIKIQIKFDRYCYKNGIFLQTHERNPNGWH
jgi:hypothetical protein